MSFPKLAAFCGLFFIIYPSHSFAWESSFFDPIRQSWQSWKGIYSGGTALRDLKPGDQVIIPHYFALEDVIVPEKEVTMRFQKGALMIGVGEEKYRYPGLRCSDSLDDEGKAPTSETGVVSSLPAHPLEELSFEEIKRRAKDYPFNCVIQFNSSDLKGKYNLLNPVITLGELESEKILNVVSFSNSTLRFGTGKDFVEVKLTRFDCAGKPLANAEVPERWVAIAELLALDVDALKQSFGVFGVEVRKNEGDDLRL